MTYITHQTQLETFQRKEPELYKRIKPIADSKKMNVVTYTKWCMPALYESVCHSWKAKYFQYKKT